MDRLPLNSTLGVGLDPGSFVTKHLAHALQAIAPSGWRPPLPADAEIESVFDADGHRSHADLLDTAIAALPAILPAQSLTTESHADPSQRAEKPPIRNPFFPDQPAVRPNLSPGYATCMRGPPTSGELDADVVARRAVLCSTRAFFAALGLARLTPEQAEAEATLEDPAAMASLCGRTRGERGGLVLSPCYAVPEELLHRVVRNQPALRNLLERDFQSVISPSHWRGEPDLTTWRPREGRPPEQPERAKVANEWAAALAQAAGKMPSPAGDDTPHANDWPDPFGPDYAEEFFNPRFLFASRALVLVVLLRAWSGNPATRADLAAWIRSAGGKPWDLDDPRHPDVPLVGEYNDEVLEL